MTKIKYGVLSLCLIVLFQVTQGYVRADAKASPLKLTLRTDKEVYSPGDRVEITYEINNLGAEAVGFYVGGWRGDFGIPEIRAFDTQGVEYKQYAPINLIDVMFSGTNNYVLLKPKEKWSQSISCPLILGQLKALDIDMGYKGLYLQLYANPNNEFWTKSIMFPGVSEGEIVMTAKLVTFDPNPENFTRDDCKNAGIDMNKKRNSRSIPKKKFLSRSEKLAMFCEDYDSLSKPTWDGEIESEPITFKIKKSTS